MISDSWGQHEVNNEGISVCFTFDGNNEEDVKKVKDFYHKVIEVGCKEVMPLGQTEWSKLYGYFNDPFGVTWMINAC